MKKEKNKENKTSLIHSIAVKIVWAVQFAVIIMAVIMIVSLMPIVKEYVPADTFADVNNKIIIIVVIGVVIAALVGTAVSMTVIIPINMLNKGVANLAKLDFRASGKEHKLAKRKDETGQIARSIFTMREALMNLVEQLKGESELLNGEAENLSVGTRETGEAIVQVERAVDEIATGANSQAEETQKATENIILIGTMVEESVGQVEKLLTNAQAMQKAGDEAIATLGQLDETNAKTKEAIDKIYEQTHTTNESAIKIKEATTIIAQIATETNLLSLNASIEAARAGEQGRGFAVVAEQIQKLAEQSNQSARQIEGITDLLIHDSEEAVATMEAVREIVDEQNANVEKTGLGFADVKAGIDTSIEGVEMISVSMEKLDEARVKVVDVVQNLTAIAEENAASTQETLATVTEVTSAMESVSGQAGTMKEVADKLDESIKVFQF